MIPHYNQISISRIKNNEVVFSEEYEDETRHTVSSRKEILLYKFSPKKH